MTTIYVIRHAEAEGNLYRVAQGQNDSILTDRGWRQVAALQRRFADTHIDAVYASDLYRTCATATAICKPKGLPLHREPGLREICVGEWEQKTWGDIARTAPEQMAYFSNQMDRWHVEGAETPQQVRDRVLAAVRKIAAENDGKTVAIFSHGCAIRILLATLQGLSIGELGHTPHGDNTAVSLLEAEGDTLRVVFRDDNRHLSDQAYLAQERPGKRANALEPGLCFEPLRLPQQEALLRACARDAGVEETALLEESQGRVTLLGYLDGRAVGAVQFHTEREAAQGRGWLSLFVVEKAFRGRGYGTQLLGQAVGHYRPLGRTCLRVALQSGTPSAFFDRRGFHPVASAGGETVLEKDIDFRPDLLGI